MSSLKPAFPSLKVLEIESLGVRVRNTKRFMVLNPTGIGYEFFWEPMGKVSDVMSSSLMVSQDGLRSDGLRRLFTQRTCLNQ